MPHEEIAKPDQIWMSNWLKKWFNIDDNKNVSWSANHHIRLISEGSCDTEDWSNDAENTALNTKIYYILYLF